MKPKTLIKPLGGYPRMSPDELHAKRVASFVELRAQGVRFGMARHRAREIVKAEWLESLTPAERDAYAADVRRASKLSPGERKEFWGTA